MGWEVRFSNSRQIPYFFNPETQKSIWEPPAELSPAELQALPGADKYLKPSGGSGQAAATAAGAGGGTGGDNPGQVRGSHILAKHKGSRRPSSWREVGWLLDFHLVLLICISGCCFLSLEEGIGGSFMSG